MISIDMKMPERCLDCPMNGPMKCAVVGNDTFDDIMRPRWCPLHEIEVDSYGKMYICKD